MIKHLQMLMFKKHIYDQYQWFDWLIKRIIYINIIKPFSAGTVFIIKNLTFTDGPRTERITIFLLVVDS